MLALAAHLGMTVGQVMRTMSVREYSAWRLEYSLRPFGERRADIRSAQICCLLANIHRDTTKRKEPYAVSDFMPFESREDEDDESREVEERDIVDPGLKDWLYAMAARSRHA